LTRLEAKDAADVARDLLAVVAELPPAERDDDPDEYGGRGYGYRSSYGSPTPPPPPTPHGATRPGMRGFLPQTLPAGSYLALVERPPAFDDLGLDVEGSVGPPRARPALRGGLR
jgi:hypothetical protein